jgi:hypothetical protein
MAAVLALLAMLGVGAVATAPASIAIGGLVISAATVGELQAAIALAQLTAGGIKAGTQLAQALDQVRKLRHQGIGRPPRGTLPHTIAFHVEPRLCFTGVPSGRSAAVCMETVE